MVKIDCLTYITGYPYEVFERFVGSLYDTGFSGNVFMICKQTDIPHMERLQHTYPNVIPIVDNSQINTTPNNHRFYVFQSFMNRYNLSCDYILVCDSRDVLFQKNIETYPFDTTIDLYGFYENKKYYEEPNWNIPWILHVERLINKELYKYIKYSNILCSGTTIGKPSAIRKYLDCMCAILHTNDTLNMIMDQGIHNYIFHFNVLNVSTKCLYNDDNLVNTVGFDVHELNEENKIVNSKKEVSYIVHQYDRFSNEKKRAISSKYNFIL